MRLGRRWRMNVYFVALCYWIAVGQSADEVKGRFWTYVSKEGRYIPLRSRSAYKRTRETNLFDIG